MWSCAKLIEDSEIPYVISEIVDDFRQTPVLRNCEYSRYSMCGEVEEPLLIQEPILVLSGGSLVEPKTFITLNENSRATARAAHVGHTRPENHFIFCILCDLHMLDLRDMRVCVFAIFQFPITRKILPGNPIDKDSRDLINAFRLILDSMKSDEGPLGISEMSQQIRNNL